MSANLPVWQPANNGGGKRMWFLIKDDNSLPVDERYYFRHCSGPLRLVRYASCESAQRAADKLNAAERTADTVLVCDVATDEMREVTRAEAAAGMARYARSLGPGTPVCGEYERKALEILRG